MIHSVEELTATEAAIAAGVSIADVNRVIDRNILPKELFSTSEARIFRKEACVFISFYFQTADSLTSAARLRAIRDGISHVENWSELESWKAQESDAIQVSFLPFARDVEARLKLLHNAQDVVVSDPEILSGIPVFKGTRIPVHDVADLMEAGTPRDEMTELYPSLTSELYDLAVIYAKAHPRRGRPRRRILPKKFEIATTKRRLHAGSDGGRKRAQTSHR